MDNSFDYDDVSVSRVATEFIRIQQTGDGETSEVYIPISDVPTVIRDIQSETPGI